MGYVFQFGDMWVARDEFVDGALNTLRLSALTMALTLVFSILGALMRP